MNSARLRARAGEVLERVEDFAGVRSTRDGVLRDRSVGICNAPRVIPSTGTPIGRGVMSSMAVLVILTLCRTIGEAEVRGQWIAFAVARR